MHPELAREFITETHGAAGHVFRAREVVGACSRGAVARRADDAPALVELPADLGFGRRHLLSLVTHRRHATQLDVRPQEEWGALGSPLVVAAKAERPPIRERKPGHQNL